MKTVMVVTGVVAAMVFGSFLSRAESMGQVTKAPTEVQAVIADKAPVEVGNKLCPVSGEKVGEMGDVVKFVHEGKSYNLCCAMCAKDFKKNPEKYSAIAEKEVAEQK